MKVLRSIVILLGAIGILSAASLALAPSAYAAVDICNTAGDRCKAFVTTYINPFIVLLTGAVGVLAVISFIIAGIQYSSSADDPGAVTKAKQRMFNTVIGLLAYIFLAAFLDYIIPGGFIK